MRMYNGILCGIIAVAALSVPSFGQLVNGNFDTGPAGRPPPGWTVWEDTQTDKIESAAGAWVHNPSPTEYGAYSFRSGEYGLGGCSGGIYQQVSGLTPEVLHTIRFKWSWAGGHSTHSHRVGVSDGEVEDGNDASPLAVAEASNTTEDYWHLIEETFTPSGHTVTVWTKVEQGSGEWTYVATWVDEIQLVEGNIDQHELQPRDPIVPIIARGTDNDTNATIYGVSLDGVSAVSLVDDLVTPTTTIDGIGILPAPDGESLTVIFPLSTETPPFGVYHLKVEKDGQTTQTVENAFEILDPALPILTNGNFEADTNPADGKPDDWTAWDRGWGSMNVALSDAGTTWWAPSPPNFEGAHSLFLWAGWNGTGDAGVVQAVRAIPGETLSLSWEWAGGDDVSDPPEGEGARHQIGVMSGAHSAGGDYHNLVDVALDNVDGGFGWDPTPDPQTFTVPAGVNWVTVDCRTWRHTIPPPPPPDHTGIATFYDLVTLEVVPGCPDQHSTSDVDPPSHGIGNFTLRISGNEYLNLVSAVLLDQGGTFVWADNDNLSMDGDDLLAPFVEPPGGFPTGTYDVVTFQPGCATVKLPGEFELTCGPTPTLDLLDVTSAKKLQDDQVEIVLTGTNLNLLETVQLILPENYLNVNHPDMPLENRTISPIDWELLDPPGDNTQMRLVYNLFDKALGEYDLVATHLSDYCDNPVKEDAFDILPPDAQYELPDDATGFQNGGFETGELLPGWTGDDLVDDGQFNFDPHGGSNYMYERASWGVPNNTGTVEQQFDLHAGEHDIVLTFYTQQFDHMFDPGSELLAEIIVDDGVDSNSIFFYEQGGIWPDEWLRASLDWSGEVTDHVTVRFDFVARNGEGPHGDGTPEDPYTIAEMMIDDVQVYVKSSCKAPFADADEDQDIDQDDFAVFQLCYTGSGPGNDPIPTDPIYCECFDRPEGGGPRDEDVDLTDLVEFEKCATGPGIQVDPDDETTWPGYGTENACEGAGYPP